MAGVLSLTAPLALADFVNFETPQVAPVALSPDGERLAVCNTADNRVEFFDLTAGDTPVSSGSVLVGLDPVSVRFRTNVEAWVVNQISDSIRTNARGRTVSRGRKVARPLPVCFRKPMAASASAQVSTTMSCP